MNSCRFILYRLTSKGLISYSCHMPSLGCQRLTATVLRPTGQTVTDSSLEPNVTKDQTSIMIHKAQIVCVCV